jgi:plasmid stabilization system protein ParE
MQTSAVRSKFVDSRRRLPWRGVSRLTARRFAQLQVGNYVIFYRAMSDGVEVVRVMSGRQDIDADDMA